MLSTDPLSTGLMNQMFKSYMSWATGKDFEGDVYVTNRLAEDFNTNDVIDFIDGMGRGEWRTEEDDEDGFELGCWDVQRQPRGPRRRGHC
eukprot:3643401-Amphidinium_carterae.1